MSLGLFERLQSDLFERLTSASYFADVGLYLFRPRANLSATQIVQKIEQGLSCIVKKAGKGGAAVTVLMPTAGVNEPSMPGPRIDPRVTIRCQENVLFNMGASGTGKSCEQIAVNVLQLCHRFVPFGLTGAVVADQDAITPNLEFDPLVTYDVNLRTIADLAAEAKVATPSIGGTASAVTITCATSGAAIYYTTDESYPRSGGSGSTLYSTAFTVSAGTRVRAAAFKSAMQPSDVMSQKF